MTKEKRGISPVIATTLLIAMVVVIGLIIFMWFRGFTQESVTKFGGTNIELVCKDVAFDSSSSGDTISISNTGNVPIYSFEVKIESPGSQESADITDLVSDWPVAGLDQGGVYSGIVSGIDTAQKVTLIPVLRGTTSNSEIRTHVCSSQYGQVI